MASCDSEPLTREGDNEEHKNLFLLDGYNTIWPRRKARPWARPPPGSQRDQRHVPRSSQLPSS